MTRSRVEELNPSHPCSTCGVMHFFIPHINLPMKDSTGQTVKVSFRPVEVTIVADGLVPFKADGDSRIATQVPIVCLIWAIPGTSQRLYDSIIGLN